MNKVKLSEVANVELSSIDKKIVQGEKSVKLCNFTDVYYNWAITKSIVDKCMKGSVNESEFSKFALKKGQVAITKDSETRSDIGMSTYISEDFDDVVLAYHCALITPKEGKVNGKYLNALLNDSYGRKYFANQASGSGQRYTLSKEAIESIKIPLPSMEKQNAIGSFFSNIDRKIELNNRINDNLSHYLDLIYDFWFSQFDFPNKDNIPYKSNYGAMCFSQKLRKMIPQGWEVVPLKKIATISSESVIPQPKTEYSHYSIPSFDELRLPNVELGSLIGSTKYKVSSNMILVSKLNPQFKRIWLINNAEENSICSTEFIPFQTKDVPIEYLFGILNSYAFNKYMVQCSSSSTGSRKRMTPELCLQFSVALPPTEIINEYSTKVKGAIKLISDNLHENSKLNALRKTLLPLLMNGQATITD